MHGISIYENPAFGSIRTLVIEDDIWFVGKDVARALGYGDTTQAIRKHVDMEDKLTRRFDWSGQSRDMIIINESGLYSLIFSSKLESARDFKHWVTSEVLPSIRKNGGYIQDQESMSSEELMAKAILVAQKVIEEKDKRIAEQQNVIDEQTQMIADRDETIAIQAPKAEYFDQLVDSRMLTTFRDAAKELHVPPKKFNDWLVEHGYIYRDRYGMIKPYEKYRREGLFQLKDFTTPAGYSNAQTYITVRGKETFRLLLSLDPIT